MASGPLPAVVCLFVACLGLASVATASELSVDFSDKEWKTRPVAKVLKVLKDMQANLAKEAEEDQELYDQMVCWCETNEKTKTKAIADGQAHDEALTELIPSLAAKVTKLTVEIDYLSKEMSKNQEALGTATELRAKELDEFKSSESSAVSAINGLTNAIKALSKSQALDQEAFIQVKSLLERAQYMDSSSAGFMQRAPAKLHNAVAAFLQQRKGTSPHEAYAPAGGEILGVLKGMKESFESNLANDKEEEADAVRSFGKLKQAKSEEIADAQEQVDMKSTAKAETNDKLTNSKEDLEDTRSQVSEDQKFLMDLQQRCGSMDKTFETRVKIRQAETKAVGEAITILDADEAHEQFAKTHPGAFVQLSAATETESRTRAKATAKYLFKAAREQHSPKLAILALAVKDDVFKKVKANIEKLVGNLEKEQAEEVETRNECIDNLNTNEKEIVGHNSYKDDVTTHITDLTLQIEKLDDEIKVHESEIKDIHIEVKKASDAREKENPVFQETVKEQQATQAIIEKAVDKLNSFYKKDAIAMSGIQTHAGQIPEAPPAFGEYKKQGSAGGVVGMMEMIIADSKKTEQEAFAAEQEAQTNYEAFVKDSFESISMLNKSIADKTKTRAEKDGDKLKSEDDLALANEDLASLAKVRKDLKNDCDWLLENFEERQASRTKEMETLDNSKAMLNGAVMP